MNERIQSGRDELRRLREMYEAELAVIDEMLSTNDESRVFPRPDPDLERKEEAEKC